MMITRRKNASMPLALWLAVVVCAIGTTFDTMTMAFAFVQNAATTTDLLSSMAPRTAMSLSDTQNQQSDDDSTSNNTAKKKDGPDLFEFFDPLLSPHAYPEGVSPEKKPIAQNNDEIQMQQQQQFRKDIEQSQQETKKMFGIQLPSPPDTTTSTSASEKKTSADEQKDDLFDYFDPLMSPHAYPDGVKPSTMSTTTTPSPLEVVGNEDSSSSNSSSSSSSSNNRRKKIGVLLMDHGSKKEKSNARLQAMANLYQLTSNGVDDDDDDDDSESTEPTIIVLAAHMEIGTPSIHDGLTALKYMGVDEIICHPFFLSADGRHVKEDIPRIIGEAIEDLWGENSGSAPIPIVTTAPVGSNTQLMLGAIHSLVRENSQYLKTTSN